MKLGRVSYVCQQDIPGNDERWRHRKRSCGRERQVYSFHISGETAPLQLYNDRRIFTFFQLVPIVIFTLLRLPSHGS
jgi:hypothetical protein